VGGRREGWIMSEPKPMRVLLIDPSLFTAPYDAALTDGLIAQGVVPTWIVRPIRDGDRQEIPAQYVDDFFYKRTERMTFLPRRLRAVAKGLAHALGLARLVARVVARAPDVVHFQWLVVPPLDALAIRLITLRCPVVLTVHDTVPFNGDRLSMLQNLAFDLPMRLSHRLIVHTRAGRDRLIERGIPDDKVAVIPHGPLQLHAVIPPREVPVDTAPAPPADPRMTFVMFGEIKPYKGPDVLIEAIGRLPPPLRRRARVVIAGRPRMELAPLLARIAALGLEETIEVRARRLSEAEMATLFQQASCFVFPYRQVDASGVYFLTKALGKWIIASRVGIFAEDVQEGVQGALVPPDDVAALVAALTTAIVEQPTARATSPSLAWFDIGRATRTLYEQVAA
jgi:glycosyltransferase involved in cell wall biosynthesis